MPAITVSPPFIGLVTYFTFKEPFNKYIRTQYNFNPERHKLRVNSIISIRDMLINDQRDAYTNIYMLANISESDYKKDLVDDMHIVSFYFKDDNNLDISFRVPLNYISSISSTDTVEYINKLIVIDLNRLPKEFNLTAHFSDIQDFIMERYGITPEIAEVAIANIELVNIEEHTTRETVRTNHVTVVKSLRTQLLEAQEAYTQLHNAYVELANS